ncbi:MAG: hypothetical protein K8J31_27005 [Anaerolineae bacterium]|nr:hypothetical protein [Anaerolineae bacterium]
MKRSFIALLVLMLSSLALPVLAQESDVITLNDAMPAVDVVVTLLPDTTGTIALTIDSAAVTLTDETNTAVFNAADPRLHALELNIAPNRGTHTLTVERLPGAAEAYVRIISLPELSLSGRTNLVQSDQLSLNQEVWLPLDAANPGDSVMVNLPGPATGLITATFPGANATTQLVDAQGLVVASSYNGHVDGMNMVVDSGDYNFTVLGNNLTDRVVTGVRAIPAAESGFVALEAPVDAGIAASSGGDCTASVMVSSANLRSGPGTGYSVTEYGYRDDVYPIGGTNPEHNWVVVATNSGSAWLSDSVAQLNGTCDGLAVFNVPLREAQPAPVIVVTPQPEVIVQSVSSGSSSSQVSSSRRSNDDDDEREDRDEGGEREERDDDD